MPLPPVIERELRVAFRRFNPRKSRFRIALIATGITALFLIIGFFTSPGWGQTLHTLPFIFGLALAIGPPAQISIGLFSEERRNQTLELLFLAGMNSRELFTSKLIGGILIASSDLLAIMPLMAIPFLSGGVSTGLFLAT